MDIDGPMIDVGRTIAIGTRLIARRVMASARILVSSAALRNDCPSSRSAS